MDGLEYCEDLSTLPELADSALLTCLEQRYRNGKVQSPVGTVLLSIRPTLPQAHLPHSHLHQLAARVGRGVADHLEDQAVLLYGQPGAGKTGTAHQLLKLLLSSLPSREGIREKVMGASLLVEALLPSEAQGLLVTSLFYDPNCEQISGAEFSFLLPDLQHLAMFQVFHWMRCGMNPSRLASLGLSPPPGQPSHKFPALEEALHGLACPIPLQEGLFATLAAVAHLLDLNEREAARVLGGCHENLQKLLESTTSYCIARHLYAHLLRWLVGWLNEELKGGAQDCRIGLVDPPCPPRDRTGGGVWQLTRGYMTEVLHNIYCLRVFDWEQEQYIEEGVDWESIVVEYNHPLQDTFEQPQGLLDSLNCSFAEELVERIGSCCTLTPNVCYTGEDAGEFIVAHYSGECTYHIDESWCEQNGELPSKELHQWLSSSSNPVIQQLSQSMADHSPDLLLGDSPSPCSLGDRVRWGMKTLTNWITTSHPHFVLCIAPSAQQGGEFDGGLVLHQLQQLRVLDTALIQSCGYPVHMSYSTFTQQYGVLLLRGTHLEVSRETCRQLLETMKLEEWRLGKSQVFLKPWHLDQLERAVTMYHMSARKLQQAFRRHFLHSNSDLQKHVVTLNTFLEYEEEEEDSTDTLSPSDSPPLPPPRPEHTLSIDEPGEEEEEGFTYLTLLAASQQASAANHTTAKGPTVSTSHKSYSPAHKPPDATPTHSPAHKPPTVTPTPAHKPDSQGEFPSSTHRKKSSWGRSENRPTSKQQPPPVEEPIKSQMWFHGKLSRGVAETRLKNVTVDCFLIRESENRVGEFALSVKYQGAVKHFRIDTKRGSGRRRFELFGAQHSFPSLTSLVDYYHEHSISSAGELLMIPCPVEVSGLEVPPQLPPRRKGLSTIRRPKPTLPSLPTNETSAERRTAWGTYRPMSLGDLPDNPDKANPALQYSDKVIRALQKELEIEQRIVEAARRMAELPTSSKKERTKRRQSLQQAQAKLLSLRQQYHTLQERRRFLEISMKTILTTRRVSEPPPLPPPRH